MTHFALIPHPGENDPYEGHLGAPRGVQKFRNRSMMHLKKDWLLQRAKNPVSASALLTGKFLRVRKIFARIIYNVRLKGSILSRQCKSHPDKIDDFKLFI